VRFDETLRISAGQALGQFAIPFVSEAIGRRGAVYTVMAILTLVRQLS
jgi:hypothetical protein